MLCDVDGTLVEPWADEVSERVCRAIRAVAASGIEFAFATGRTTESLRPIVNQIGLPQVWAACSNGAVLARYDDSLPDGVETIHEKPIDPAEAVRRLLVAVPGAIVASWHDGVYWTTRPFPAGELVAERVTPYRDVVGSPTTKAVLRWLDRTSADVRNRVARTEMPAGVNAVASKLTAWLDLLPIGVSKAATALELAKILDIDASEVMAIGDDFNDIDMLHWAGRGVAMRGSPTPVLAVADALTATVEEDGVALVLEELVSEMRRTTSR